MKIFINYKNNNILLNNELITKNYESINSIINNFLIQNNINDKIQNFFLDYNGIYLNNNYSLEKYNIKDSFHLNLNKIIKGGNSFMSFAKKNPAIVAISFIIALMPVFILPMGFISATASLLKIIIEKSFESIGRYLVCDLGKITMYKRLILLVNVIKYSIFILMIYVIITFPLIILCVTLKGHSIKDNPKDMCSGISTGNLTGLILTIIYVIIYLIFRSGNYILNPLINLCKQSYISNIILVPFLSSILGLYNNSKYLVVGFVPFVGEAFMLYFNILELSCYTGENILHTVTDLGCKMHYSKETFMKTITKNINKPNKQDENNKHGENNKDVLSYTKEEICNNTKSRCCNPDNFVFIADNLIKYLENSVSSLLLKRKELYSQFALFTQGLYEAALLEITNNKDNLLSKDLSEQKIYLRKLLEENINKISINTKDLIKKYLNNNNEDLLVEISKDLDKNLSIDTTKNIDKINDIKYKIELLNQYMIEYSKENNSKYISGNTLFKTVIKMVFLDIFCNVVSTTNTTQDIILKMGKMVEVIDMLKAGSATGLYMGMIYLLTVIILIVCGIFNMF
jgi:hypothetical protein